MTLTGIREGFITSRVPLIQYTASLVILPLVFAAVTFCVQYFGSGIFVIGYYIAVGIGLLMGLPKSGKNPANLNEYMTSNAPFMDRSKLAEAMGESSTPKELSNDGGAGAA